LVYPNTCVGCSRIHEEILEDEIGDIDMIIPVPLHWLKKRERGYNQAFWLAKGLASIYAVPVDTSIIKRTRYTVSHTMLGSTECMVNLDVSFTINKSLNNQHILLVDDVLTTGSTISNCAKVLRKWYSTDFRDHMHNTKGRF